MATINFVNNTLIAGTTANPGLEDVLSATGPITANTASLFEITNTSGGQFNGFRFQLTSSASDFTYGGTTPTGGTIDGITVLAPDGTTHIVEVTGIGGPVAEQSLAIFFEVLNNPDLGPLFALDVLLSSENTVNGSGVADHATAFGFFGGGFVFGNGGDDVLSGRDMLFSTLVGGAGNDVLRVESTFLALAAGANADGTGGAGETNTLEVSGSAFASSLFTLSETISNINVLHFVDDRPAGRPQHCGSSAGDRVRTRPDRQRPRIFDARRGRLFHGVTAFPKCDPGHEQLHSDRCAGEPQSVRLELQQLER